MIGHISERAGVVARLALSPLFAFAAVIGTTASTAHAKGVQNNVPAELQTAFQTITSSGPLNEIFLGVDVSSQISHTGDGTGEIFPPETMPGDYGTFLVVGATLFAPDFANHGGSATGSIGPYVTYTPISQTAVSGTGTNGDPFTVTTVVGVPAAGLDGVGAGLTITQVDSYVVGQESYRTAVTVANSTAAPVDAILYRAMDCYLGGSDSGYGMLNGTAVGCSANPNNVPAGRIEQIVPLTAGNNYFQSSYGAVWAAIGTHQPFPNTCDCEIQQDNGAGISWNITVPAGGSITRSNVTVFSPTGAQALFVTKTADIANVAAGASDGYTITVNNPGVDATVNSISDTLPPGFTYTAGSSSGVTTTDPSIAAGVLTWTGPFAVSAGGSLTLHFGVTVAAVDGTYTNQASVDAGAGGVAGTGATAPVTVGGGGPPPGPVSTPTLGSGMLAALILLLLAAGLFVGRRARR